MWKFSRYLAVAAAALTLTLAAPAQDILHPKDTSALHPPPGYKVAIVEFADLECPMCAMENPVLMQAVEKYHVAWERHDFPIPGHVWSFQAAVNARWFDTRSKKLGDDYRNAIFANQASIETKSDLQNFTQKFAQQHGTALPFVMDPQGKLAGRSESRCGPGQPHGRARDANRLGGHRPRIQPGDGFLEAVLHAGRGPGAGEVNRHESGFTVKRLWEPARAAGFFFREERISEPRERDER